MITASENFTTPLPQPSDDQINLFLALFRGRADDWTESGSPNRDEVGGLRAAVTRHLAGEAQVAIHPCRADGTTFLAAIGLHQRAGRTWKTDALLLARAADRLGVPLYLERTRSGLGIHAWIFFSEAVPVPDARRLCFAILVEASPDGSALKSRERIAPAEEPDEHAPLSLPLHGAALRAGLTVWVQAARGLPAIPDQWAVLAALRRLDSGRLHSILARHTGAPEAPPAPAPSPTSADVAVVLTARLVLRRPLHIDLARRLRQRLAVANPEYQRRRAGGQSLRNVARLATAFQRRGDAWLLPRGAAGLLSEWCAEQGGTLHALDARYRFDPVPRDPPRGLNERQQAALQAVLGGSDGILEAPDGGGRLIVALAAAALRGVPTLVLVGNGTRLQQWREEAILWLGLDDADIATLDSEGRPALPPPTDLGPQGAFLTLGTYGVFTSRLPAGTDSRFGFAILDDCRRTPMPLVREALHALPCPLLLGLADSARRGDGLDALLELYLGGTVHRMGGPPEALLDVVLRATSFQWQESDGRQEPGLETESLFGDALPDQVPPAGPPSAAGAERARAWNALVDALSRDPHRNAMVVRDVVSEAKQGHACLVYTARREHAVLLAELIGREVPVALAVGNLSQPQRREALRRFRERETGVIVVTEQLAGAGFEAPHLERVFLVFPMKSDGMLRQCLSRVTRPSDQRASARVYDYLDENVPRLEAMARSRRRFYRREHTTLNPDATQLRLPFDPDEL